MITDLPPAIPEADVLRLLGYPPGHPVPARVRARLDQLLPEAVSQLEPRGAAERIGLDAAAALELPPPGPEDAVSGLILALVTIGPRLEEQASRAAGEGDATQALLLDAIGSAAVEAAAGEMSTLLAGGIDGGPGGDASEAARLRRGERLGEPPGPRPNKHLGRAPGAFAGSDSVPSDAQHRAPCRVSPGYGGWPLRAQEAIFARLPHETLGVRLLPSMLMVPRKSVTFALWLDPAGQVIAGHADCSRCALERCPRRIRP